MALGVALAELTAFGADYARACVANAQALARGSRREVRAVCAERGYTQSNQVCSRPPNDVSADEVVERWRRRQHRGNRDGVAARNGRCPPGRRASARVPGAHPTGNGHLGDGARAVPSEDAVWGRDSDGVKSRVAELVGDFPTVYYCFEHPNAAALAARLARAHRRRPRIAP